MGPIAGVHGVGVHPANIEPEALGIASDIGVELSCADGFVHESEVVGLLVAEVAVADEGDGASTEYDFHLGLEGFDTAALDGDLSNCFLFWGELFDGGGVFLGVLGFGGYLWDVLAAAG